MCTDGAGSTRTRQRLPAPGDTPDLADETAALRAEITRLTATLAAVTAKLDAVTADRDRLLAAQPTCPTCEGRRGWDAHHPDCTGDCQFCPVLDPCGTCHGTGILIPATESTDDESSDPGDIPF